MADRNEEDRLLLAREREQLENEKKRLRKESLHIEQQLSILKDGFRKLDEDKMQLEKERRKFLQEQLAMQSDERECCGYCDREAVQLLFRNTDNPLALQKRYRDLIKIFHPDNLFGDKELVQQINREYARRSKRKASS